MTGGPLILVALGALAALGGCAAAPDEPPAVPAAAAEAGLWIGPVHLCRDTVDSVESVRDPDGSAALLLRLKPAARRDFARWTGAQVGRKMAIRLDGRTLSEAVINEPILGGAAQISGVSEDVEAAARSAKRPC